MSDGRLWFNTKIDNSQVEKDLKDLERKIQKSEEAISKSESAKLPYVKQAEELNKRLTEARQNLKSLKSDMVAAQSAMASGASAEDRSRAAADLPALRQAVTDQEREVAALQKQWDTAKAKVEKYDIAIKQANTDIERSKVKASELNAKLATPSQIKTAQAMERANKAASKFGKRLWEIGKSALIFNLISTGLRSVVNYMGTALKSNSEYTHQLAQLKGAWLTAFQPIYEFVLPGLLAIMRILTAIGNALAAFFSFFSGKTAKQSAANAEALNKEATAIKGVGSAAEEAKKQIMGFDEINRLETSENSSGGGGGGSSGTIAPDFSGITDMEDDLLDILGIISAIAAGLLTWKIASAFTNSLSLAAGLALAVGGAFLYAFNWADAFANGIGWGNLTGMLGGMIVLAVGLGWAFGAVGAAVGLLIGSVGIIVTALNQFSKTGEVTDEMLVGLAASLVGVGLAITMLTGNPLPLIISLVLGIGTAFGLTSDTIRNAVATALSWILTLWQSIKDFFTWIAGNWSRIFGSFSMIAGEMIQTAPIPSVRTTSVPALAQGAVIPPNAPFLAMLGDQRNGTNVEAPLETIKQALAEVMAEQGWDVNVNFTGSLAQLARVLCPEITREQRNSERGRGG